MEVVEKVRRLGLQEKLWTRQSSVVVAVSGGIDSMALLHILSCLAHEEELNLIVAHVNHGFREEESLQEAELVKTFATQLGLPFEYTELQMPQYLELHQVNSQAASRERRYDFFFRIAERYNAQSIALAHHADDLAETVLMNVIRGTGLTGLSGIVIKRSEKNMELIRPLLRMKKDTIIQYCAENEVPYLQDSSNFKRDYYRNRIRLDVFPYLEQYNSQLSQSLARLAEVATEEDQWMTQQTQLQFDQLVQKEFEGYALLCQSLINLHVALQRRLIKLILSYLSLETQYLTFEGIERMRMAAVEQAASTWRIDIGNGVVCVREYDVLRFIRPAKKSQLEQMPWLCEVTQDMTFPYSFEHSGWKFHIEIWNESAGTVKPMTRFEAVFDIERLEFPLTFRTRLMGDRMQVLGLNGTKKVQDMFVDAKIAPSERDTYPILLDQNARILWIPGIRRSIHGLIDSESSRYLFVRINKIATEY